MRWKCPKCYTEYDIDSKYKEVLKDKEDCKFCVRKDPNIPTAAEMCGLERVEDMRRRNDVVFQCIGCSKWTTHTNWIPGDKNKHIPCENCGDIKYDASSIRSLRTYNPLKDNKRRIKTAIRRK